MTFEIGLHNPKVATVLASMSAMKATEFASGGVHILAARLRHRDVQDELYVRSKDCVVCFGDRLEGGCMETTLVVGHNRTFRA